MNAWRVLAAILFLVAPHVHSEEVLQVINLGLDTTSIELVHTREHGDWVRTSVAEGFRTGDINGDGDSSDYIHRLDNLVTRDTRFVTTPFPAEVYLFSEGWLVSIAHESNIGADLNQDGDLIDSWLDTYDIDTQATWRIALVAGPDRLHWNFATLDGHWLAFQVAEGNAGADIDGDGDANDLVITIYNVVSGEARVIGLPAVEVIGSGNKLFLRISEELYGADLNGDGKVNLDRHVLYSHDIVTNETKDLGLSFMGRGPNVSALIGSHDEQFVALAKGSSREDEIHISDYASGQTRPTGLFARQGLLPINKTLVHRGLLVCELHEGSDGARRDLNGDGDTEDSVIHLYDLAMMEASNLGIVLVDESVSITLSHVLALSGDWFMAQVPENEQGTDLNSDGDRTDRVVHIHNLRTGETRNTRLTGNWTEETPIYGDRLVVATYDKVGTDFDYREDIVIHSHGFESGDTLTGRVSGVNDNDRFFVYDNWLLFGRNERWLKVDFNGDGDESDSALTLYDIRTDEARKLGFSTGHFTLPFERVFGGCVVFGVDEIEEREDLNSNGDARDKLLYLHGTTSGATLLAGYAGYFLGELTDGSGVLMVYLAEEDRREDLNGDGDERDDIPHLLRLAPLTRHTYFRRGDCNDDALVDLSDAICVLTWLFLGTEAPGCVAAVNSNGDALVDLADAIYLLNHLFLGGAGLPPPYPECGSGSVPSDEGACQVSRRCAASAAAGI